MYYVSIFFSEGTWTQDLTKYSQNSLGNISSSILVHTRMFDTKDMMIIIFFFLCKRLALLLWHWGVNKSTRLDPEIILQAGILLN